MHAGFNEADLLQHNQELHHKYILLFNEIEALKKTNIELIESVEFWRDKYFNLSNAMYCEIKPTDYNLEE